MATFETARLYGGRDKLEFGATDETTIAIWFHHAQGDEIAIALDAAGLERTDDGETVAKGGGGDFVTSARAAQSAVELACLCIESIDNFDGWREPHRDVGSHGLNVLRPAQREAIPRIVLQKVGEEIFRLAALGDDEKKD